MQSSQILSKVSFTNIIDDMYLLLQKQDVLLSAEVKENIASIQKICDENYQDQKFFGASALNRKILHDGKISKLLTPETILGIFWQRCQITGKISPDNSIALQRKSGNITTIADVIYYALKDGLDTIKLMPTNDHKYDVNMYEQQKQNFEDNTLPLLANLLEAAKRLKLDLENRKYCIGTAEEENLLDRFIKIKTTIARIKENNQSKELLFVPNVSQAAISNEAIRGFLSICHLMGIEAKHDRTNQSILINDQTDLALFANMFLGKEEILLNGDVSHGLDRVHLEACLECDVKIILNDKAYFLRDFFQEVISQCANDTKYKLASEQFGLRLKLVNDHLRSLEHAAFVKELKEYITTRQGERGFLTGKFSKELKVTACQKLLATAEGKQSVTIKGREIPITFDAKELAALDNKRVKGIVAKYTDVLPAIYVEVKEKSGYKLRK